jgi:hypothetical protein
MRGGDPGVALFEAYGMSTWPGSTTLDIQLRADAGPIFVVPDKYASGLAVGCDSDCSYTSKDSTFQYMDNQVRNVVIRGISNSNGLPIVRGNEAKYQIFYVPPERTLTLSNVQLDRGKIVNYGTLLVDNAHFEWAIFGSGIYNHGLLSATSTMFRYSGSQNERNGRANFTDCTFAYALETVYILNDHGIDIPIIGEK